MNFTEILKHDKPTLLRAFLEENEGLWREPERCGIIKGREGVVKGEKYLAALLTGLTMIPLKETAAFLGVSAHSLRAWQAQEKFKNLKKQLAANFAEKYASLLLSQKYDPELLMDQQLYSDEVLQHFEVYLFQDKDLRTLIHEYVEANPELQKWLRKKRNEEGIHTTEFMEIVFLKVYVDHLKKIGVTTETLLRKLVTEANNLCASRFSKEGKEYAQLLKSDGLWIDAIHHQILELLKREDTAA